MTTRNALASVPFLFALLLAPACGRGGEDRSDAAAGEPIAVRVVAIADADWTGASVLPATIQAVRQAAPGTVLMGRVEQVLHREGDRVRAGAVLARIESGEVAARVAQAEAAVAAARAGEENARLLESRMERLHARQAAPKKGLDDAIAGHADARAGRVAAEEGVAAARSFLAYASVRAPFDGVVTARHVETGDLAAPGMPLFTVEDLTRVKVEAQVAESSRGALAAGSPVEVELAGGGAPRAARLAEILPSADPATRTWTVRVLLDNPDGSLRSGTFARLRLPGGGERSPVVPRASIVRSGPLTGVFVVAADGIARLRWISIGEERGEELRVLAGLSAGERVVIEPPAPLEDGRRVQVR